MLTYHTLSVSGHQQQKPR